MTGWTRLYILDDTTLDFLMMVHKYGIDFEETKSIILVNKIAEGLFGTKNKKSKPKIDVDKPPPKYAELKAMFGNKVQKLVKK